MQPAPRMMIHERFKWQSTLPRPVREMEMPRGPQRETTASARPSGPSTTSWTPSSSTSTQTRPPKTKRTQVPGNRIKIITKVVDHTYRDFSRCTLEEAGRELARGHGGRVDGVSRRDGRVPFPRRLYNMVTNPDYQHIIRFMPHGRSWVVLDKEALVTEVLPKYFNHSKFESFNRQVNGWGFKRLMKRGPDYKSYYHECFLRSRPEFTTLMIRLVNPGKRLPDRNTEPDFYKISSKNPLPEILSDPIPTGHFDSSSNSALVHSQQDGIQAAVERLISESCTEVDDDMRRDGHTDWAIGEAIMATAAAGRGANLDRGTGWSERTTSFSSHGVATFEDQSKDKASATAQQTVDIRASTSNFPAVEAGEDRAITAAWKSTATDENLQQCVALGIITAEDVAGAAIDEKVGEIERTTAGPTWQTRNACRGSGPRSMRRYSRS